MAPAISTPPTASAPSEGPPRETTRDALFSGGLTLVQPANGYRCNVDALLLAHFARQGGERRSGAAGGANHACDLGAGAGAVGLSVLHLGGARRATLVEIDPFLVVLARENARINAFAEYTHVVEADVAGLSRPDGEVPRGSFDLVVCNPPYTAPGRGRAPDPVRARARSGELSPFVDAARQLLGRRGRACFVYPAGELVTLLEQLRGAGLEPKRLRAVHAFGPQPARVVLVEAMAGRAGGLTTEPPWIERDAAGYTDELGRLLSSTRTFSA